MRLTALVLALCCALPARAEIYRWTDAQGRAHFGDRPPQEAAQSAQNLSATYAAHVPFTFDIVTVDYAMPAETHAKVEVAVAKIHEVYRSRLATPFRTDPSFTIRIFNDEKGFSGYGGGPTPVGPASGYFSPQRNEAVTWRQRSFDQLLEVITHEANHALLHHRFGGVPPWLDEGLSEYFERMEVFGLAVVIHPNPQWDALVKAKVRDGSIMPLKDYLGLAQRDWQIHNLPDNGAYAQAWSLVYFLMSSREGTGLLGRLLNRLDRLGAKDFSAADAIEAEYDGGLAALETAWRSFVFSQKQPHHL